MAVCGICLVAARVSYPANLLSLTRLRFFAALWVVFYHWRAPWDFDVDATTQLLAMGRFGVDLFFILSGFVLAHVYLRAREEGRFNFARFLVARFARIWPLHIAVILFLLLVWFVAAALEVPFEADRFAVADLPANILMIHAWGFAPDLSWNGPSWSISAEWFAYLTFPAYLMTALGLKHRPWLLLGIAAVLFFALDQLHLRLFSETLPMATERFGVIRIIPEFLIGIGLYRLGQAYVLPRPVARYAFIGVLAVYLLAAHFAWDDRVIALLGAPIIFLLAELDRHKGETRTGAMSYLGDISYSVYMIHVPFFMVGFNLLQDVLGVVDQTVSWPVLLMMLVVMIGVSAGTYEWIERPARTRLRAWGEALISRPRRP
jgi:peptidoglycan/LPS O-acetylase OafA/YrhL